jgi:hypothetical protein
MIAELVCGAAAGGSLESLPEFPKVPHAESAVSAAISAEPIANRLTGLLILRPGVELRLEGMFG